MLENSAQGVLVSLHTQTYQRRLETYTAGDEIQQEMKFSRAHSVEGGGLAAASLSLLCLQKAFFQMERNWPHVCSFLL